MYKLLRTEKDGPRISNELDIRNYYSLKFHEKKTLFYLKGRMEFRLNEFSFIKLLEMLK